MSKSDRIYAQPRGHLVDFTFDEDVADVFPDMIRRSVPGYDNIITLVGVLAGKHYIPGSRIYDLGCSLGAATLSVHRRLSNAGASYIVVDNAAAMLDRCRENLARHMPSEDIEFVHGDIRNVLPENASVVILNFSLQFVPQEDRQAMVDTIYSGMRPGGVLILSEKIRGESEEDDRRMIDLHHEFKAANGYSELEISQKRSALENVMQLDTISRHQARLAQSGFSVVSQWFQCLNFVSLMAVK